MLGLRQQVGSHKDGIALVIGYDAHLTRAGRHVDGHVVEAHLLLGRHHILIARTKDLIHFWHAPGAISHGSYCLHTAGLENLADTSNARSGQNGGIYFASAFGRGA